MKNSGLGIEQSRLAAGGAGLGEEEPTPTRGTGQKPSGLTCSPGFERIRFEAQECF